jgi:hypothetical protein
MSGILKMPRTSARKVTFKSPAKNSASKRKRRSKKKSHSIVNSISKAMKYSPTKFKNPYMRDLAELSLLLTPAIIAALYIYVHKGLKSSSESSVSSEPEVPNI